MVKAVSNDSDQLESAFQSQIDNEVIDEVLKPIEGINTLIKDSPRTREMKHKLYLYQSASSNRNRKQLREIMMSTKPTMPGDEGKRRTQPMRTPKVDITKILMDDIERHCNRIMNTNHKIANDMHMRPDRKDDQITETMKEHKRYAGENQYNLLALKH